MNIKLDSYVLIVEDSPEFRFLLTQFFDAEGIPIKSTSNGQEALDLLRSAKVLPSFILLDMMMPVMDGFTFRKEQQKDPRLATIPIIVMTADSHVEEKSASVSATGFLKKPFMLDDLIKTATQFQSKN